MSDNDLSAKRPGRAVNVRLEDDLYEALAEASEFRGYRSVADAVRAACALFVADAAEDDLPVREIAERHAALKERARVIAENETKRQRSAARGVRSTRKRVTS